MNIKKEAYNKAIEVLEKCITPIGFTAANPSYQAIWSRDSMITSLGASLVGKPEFKDAFKKSLNILAEKQSELGQIPNAVHIKGLKADFASIDSSLWFIIGEHLYAERFKDKSLLKKHKKNIEKAFLWLRYQDFGEDSLPEQQPTSDWQDAFPHRYGHTIHTQALYFKVLNLLNKKEIIKKVVARVNHPIDGLWNKDYFYSYRWKNHNKYNELGEWFDSLANILAIVYGLADKRQSDKILDYIKKEKIDVPYTVKCMYPAIKRDSRDWYDYFLDCEADKEYHYSNGGIWPYVGGFYILALIKQKRFKEAEKQLEKLAELNMKKNGAFWEWFDGKTGEPGTTGWKKDNKNQAWNAGMYILAYESLKKKKVLI
jgi:glycogen debranching enzyme